MANPTAAIVSRSLRLLERKERTVSEIRKYFSARGEDPEAIEDAVSRLSQMGLLDDSRYAQRYIDGPARHKGYGRARIYRELLARGVDGDLVQEALEECHDKEAEFELLVKAGRRKWEELVRSGVPEEKVCARLYAHLGRRGFSQRGIMRFIEELGELPGGDRRD